MKQLIECVPNISEGRDTFESDELAISGQFTSHSAKTTAGKI